MNKTADNIILVDEEVKIVEFDKFEAELVEFESKYKGLVYDLDDEDQTEYAKQNKKELRKSWNALEKSRKEKKKFHQDKVTHIDSSGKVIRDRIDVLVKEIDDQTEVHASKAIKHAAKLHERVEFIESYSIFEIGEAVNLKMLDSRLKAVNKFIVDSSFENREADAALAKMKAVESLEGKIALLEKQEAQAKADEEQRIKDQAAREEQIRVDAAAEAEAEKERVIEKAKQDKIAAELQAEQAAEDAKNAKLKAKKDAAEAESNRIIAENLATENANQAAKKAEQDKQDAITAERKKAEQATADKVRAEEQEKARLKAIEVKEAAALKAKQDNVQNRAEVHTRVKIRLIAMNVDEVTAIAIVKALSRNEFKDLTINY